MYYDYKKGDDVIFVEKDANLVPKRGKITSIRHGERWDRFYYIFLIPEGQKKPEKVLDSQVFKNIEEWRDKTLKMINRKMDDSLSKVKAFKEKIQIEVDRYAILKTAKEQAEERYEEMKEANDEGCN